MGQLPSYRVTPSPPFEITGLDFAGPFMMNKGHTRKLVIVMFCTKTIHIEIVSDLTTEAFVAST